MQDVVANVVKQTIDEFGRIDVLIKNAIQEIQRCTSTYPQKQGISPAVRFLGKRDLTEMKNDN